MSWDPAAVVVVVNPAAGAVGRRWGDLEAGLRAGLGPVRFAWTAGPRDGARCVADAVAGGARVVCAVGGDGTHGEVAGALAWSGVAFAAIPAGTGGDFCRNLAWGRDWRAAAAAIPTASARDLDLGTWRIGEASGRFLNLVSFGLSGRVVRRMQGRKKRFGAASYALGGGRALAGWSPSPLEGDADGAPIATGPLTLGVLANGPWAGGGLAFAAGADLADGQLDLVTVGHRGLVRTITGLRHLIAGRLAEQPGVATRRVREVHLRTPGIDVEADGEWIGETPASFGIEVGAVRVLGA